MLTRFSFLFLCCLLLLIPFLPLGTRAQSLPIPPSGHGVTGNQEPGNSGRWVTLHIRVFLEGPFQAGGMNVQLLSQGILPYAQPYTIPPWNHNGMENTSIFPPNAVDWVLVELRDAQSAAQATAATKLSGWPKAMLLLANGQIVSPDGNLPYVRVPASPQGLYAVIRHRNHLDVMSADSLEWDNGSYAYDFTTSLETAWGGTAGYKEIAPGKYGMVAADCDADGTVLTSDFNQWAWDFGCIEVYLSSDVDLDGQVMTSDFNFWSVNFGADHPLESGNDHLYRSQVP